MSYKLIISIVPRNFGEGIVKAANNAGASGGTVLMGQGTAANNILSLLGFGSASKDVVFVLVPDEICPAVLSEIKNSTENKKKHFGVVWTIDVNRFMKGGEISGGKTMNENSGHQMITLIVNKGYAEDVMAAARKAGAGGGTVINARGTAKEGDAKFFGMEIVPEKEMLLILVPDDKCEAVMEAVKNLPCLQTPGSGISFCIDAGNFSLLGQK